MFNPSFHTIVVAGMAQSVCYYELHVTSNTTSARFLNTVYQCPQDAKGVGASCQFLNAFGNLYRYYMAPRVTFRMRQRY